MRKKYERNRYGLMEPEAVVSHLTKMAVRGWQLSSIGLSFWVYEQAEPQETAYAITYYPEASFYDSAPTEGQRDYMAYCEAGGWQLAATWAQAQIFRAVRPDPIPLETDETLKLETIHRSIRKAFFLPLIVLFLCFSLIAGLVFQSMPYAAFSYLSSNTRLMFLPMLAWGVLWPPCFFLRHFIWYHRSQNAVAAGGRCVRQTLGPRLLWEGLAAATVILFAAALLTDTLRGFFPYTMLLRSLLWCGILMLIRLLIGLAKRKGLSRDAVRVVHIGSAIVLSLLFFWTTPNLSGSADSDGIADLSEVPLTAADLGLPQEGESDWAFYEHSDSVFLEFLDVYQPNMPHVSLSYARYVPKTDWVRALCMERLLDQQTWDTAEAAPWRAGTVYYRHGDANHHRYLAVYENAILEVAIHASPLTEGQIETVVSRLGLG